jgi:hypothetical protein
MSSLFYSFLGLGRTWQITEASRRHSARTVRLSTCTERIQDSQVSLQVSSRTTSSSSLDSPEHGKCFHLKLVEQTSLRCDPDNKPVGQFDWDDTHSPAPYRILGTLQNYEAFRAAFNCPSGAKYAPEKTCKVWITDLKPQLQVPTPEPQTK